MGLLDYRLWVLLLGIVLAGPGWAAQWPHERTAGPFQLHADFALAEHDALIQELGHLQSDLYRQLRIAASPEVVHVFLFQHKSTYQRYVGHYFPQVPTRRALFIKARGPGMVFAYHSSDLAVDVRHESTHALLHAVLPFVPLWLDEGLAEYFEVPRDQRTSQNPHQTSIQWSARLGQAPSLERLEQITRLEDMGRTEYRHAWAWTHFLLHGPAEARAELLAYLADLQAHVPPGQLSDRLRRRIPNLERRFVQHFRQWK